MQSIRFLRNTTKLLAASQRRNFSKQVYLWSRVTGVGTKGTDLKQQYSLPKGVPQRVEAFSDLNVQVLRVGMRHSAAISEAGDLYMFGAGNWGVLGQGNETDISWKSPKVVSKFQKLGLKVIDVALGEYHTLAITDDGSVWTWGYAGKKGFFNWMYTQEIGALGHGDKEPHFTPKKVEFFENNKLEVKSISAGLYHCNVLTEDGDIYSWGRGLYGVLGNGSNKHSMSPALNDIVQAIKEEDPVTQSVVRMDSADEFSVIQLGDGTIHAWGKNDRGQMGTGPGIGIDMVECENIPTPVLLENGKKIKKFAIGQNTQMIQDEDNDIHLVGLKLHYHPTKLDFNEELVDINNIRLIACGKKHFVIVNEENNMLVWGNMLKDNAAGDKPDGIMSKISPISSSQQSEGFAFHSGDALFDNGKIENLEVKYGIYGALISYDE